MPGSCHRGWGIRCSLLIFAALTPSLVPLGIQAAGPVPPRPLVTNQALASPPDQGHPSPHCPLCPPCASALRGHPVWVPRQARRQTPTGPHLLVQLPVLEERLVPGPTGRHRAPPAPARGATLSSCRQRRPQQQWTHPFLTDGQGISDTVIFPLEAPGPLTPDPSSHRTDLLSFHSHGAPWRLD